MISNPSIYNVDDKVDIDYNTQVSLDMSNLETLGDLVTDHFTYTSNPTDFHLQKESNLCHSFAILSVFRHCLILFMKSNPSKNIISKLKVKFNAIDIIREMKKPYGEYSYEKFMKIFVACVNPRSFQGVSSQRNEQKFTEKQFANLETVIKRLVLGTTFETEGWKRLLPAREIFKKLSLKIDDYKLKMEKVKKIDFEVRLR